MSSSMGLLRSLDLGVGRSVARGVIVFIGIMERIFFIIAMIFIREGVSWAASFASSIFTMMRRDSVNFDEPLFDSLA